MNLQDVKRKLANRLAACEYQASLVRPRSESEFFHGKANAYTQALEWLSEIDEPAPSSLSGTPNADREALAVLRASSPWVDESAAERASWRFEG